VEEVRDASTFTMTNDHLTLLRNACVEWQDCETGAPAIDPKRPYGNSSVGCDVAEILGWKPDGDDDGPDYYSEHQLRLASQLHRETETALQIILTTGRMQMGVYRATENYGRGKPSWELVP